MKVGVGKTGHQDPWQVLCRQLARSLGFSRGASSCSIPCCLVNVGVPSLDLLGFTQVVRAFTGWSAMPGSSGNPLVGWLWAGRLV